MIRGKVDLRPGTQAALAAALVSIVLGILVGGDGGVRQIRNNVLYTIHLNINVTVTEHGIRPADIPTR
ncbi:hypothetical protein EMIT0P4_130118 [Pseudomonas sp. IT-P4]